MNVDDLLWEASQIIEQVEGDDDLGERAKVWNDAYVKHLEDQL